MLAVYTRICGATVDETFDIGQAATHTVCSTQPSAGRRLRTAIMLGGLHVHVARE
jgi:hypothetical protein